MKKQIILTMFIVLCLIGTASADILKTSCGILTEPNTRYYMTSDIYDYELTVCFSLDQINQTLDCQGHTINGDVALMTTSISVPYEGGKVMNCNIQDSSVGIGIGSGSTLAGIFNVNITNNTFFNLGDSADCIVGQGITKGSALYSFFNSEISYNTFNYLNGADVDGNRCGDISYAIKLSISNNNRIFGNTLTKQVATNYPDYGISLVGSNNVVKDNSISGTYLAGFVMDSHQNSSGHIYTNNTIINLTQSNSLLYGFKAISEYYQVFNSSFQNNKYGMYFGGVLADENGGGGHSNFTNILINNSNTSIYLYYDGNGWAQEVRFKDLNIINSTDWDIYDSRDAGENIYFINATYNLSKEFESVDYLYRYWYYSAYVNDSLGNNVNNANVTAYDKFGTKQFNLTTNSNGLTGIANILEYMNDGSSRTYYSNYTIYASDSLGHRASHTYNVTAVQNYQDKFQLSCWSWLNRLFDYPAVCGSDIDSALKEIFI